MKNHELGWTAKALLIAILGSVLGMLVVAIASAAPSPTILGDATKCERCIRRCEREQCAGTPLPSPSPTRAPEPTAVQDCSDGRFQIDATARQLSLSRVILTKGKIYHYCATVPNVAMQRPWIQVNSVNGSNGVCNLYSMWLVAPSGQTTVEPKTSQPGAVPKWETGIWNVLLQLDPDDSLCTVPKDLTVNMLY